jgi:deoxyribodipyrimidine photo-lyase
MSGMVSEPEGRPLRPIIVWFRRDLRTDDHAALIHAAKQHVPLVPLFIFDTELILSLPSDGAAFNFQAEALVELGQQLHQLGGTLITRHGRVSDVHREIIHELHPLALYYNRDYEPNARERDAKIEQIYREADIEVHSFKDAVAHEPDEVLTGKGAPYVVFTPYANAWKKLSHPLPFTRPRSFSTPHLPHERLLGARELGKPIAISDPAFVGGERQARRRWRHFLQSMIGAYAKDRDLPAVDGTSKLSAYLRFGCISIRRMIDDCDKALRHATTAQQLSIKKFVDELIWREFYVSVLYHYPDLTHSNYREEFDKMPWKFSTKLFNAWKEGRTGFPLVDAGMRQLNQTGWMHNRVRMVVASFLTKDLRHDWRKGAAYFETKLMDIETSSNNGGWQWAASTGVDPKPLRIFNPRLQSERFDPEGDYIKRFVPELRRVPAKYIHAPHALPPTLQKEIGCVIGKHYPAPIVDHAAASAEYKRLFAAIKSR